MHALLNLSLILGSGLRWPTLSDFSYQAAGMLVVVGSLGLLAIGVSLIGKALRLPETPAKPQTVPVPRAEAAEPASGGIPEDIRIVIAAAVAATLEHPHRIASIRTQESIWLQAWSAEGRREIFHSHQVR